MCAHREDVKTLSYSEVYQVIREVVEALISIWKDDRANEWKNLVAKIPLVILASILNAIEANFEGG